MSVTSLLNNNCSPSQWLEGYPNRIPKEAMLGYAQEIDNEMVELQNHLRKLMQWKIEALHLAENLPYGEYPKRVPKQCAHEWSMVTKTCKKCGITSAQASVQPEYPMTPQECTPPEPLTTCQCSHPRFDGECSHPQCPVPDGKTQCTLPWIHDNWWKEDEDE